VLIAEVAELSEPKGERRRQRIVGIITKAHDLPVPVGRRSGPARLAPEAAELGDVLVANLPWRQTGRQAPG
jgi:hypothetical protein